MNNIPDYYKDIMFVNMNYYRQVKNSDIDCLNYDTTPLDNE